jgi:hypothetical protein
MNPQNPTARPDDSLHLPAYPKAFITFARLARERDRVFVAMPFEAEHSTVLWNVIHGVCEIHGLTARRGDSSSYPNPIVADILAELERAEIIIVDLTDLNPNVLYELGMAHVRCDSVILVCREGQKLPFDLSTIRCIFFDLSTPGGRIKFGESLGKTLQALRAVGPPVVIKSKLDRTELIVKDLQSLATLTDEELRNEVVWFSGFLSSFAIGPDESFEPGEEKFRGALQEERDALLTLARRGCVVRNIISPPIHDVIADQMERACVRMRYLLKFLQSDDEALKNIDWAVSPYKQKNLYIIGRLSYFEGYKKPHHTGYSLTLRQSSLEAVRANASLYEVLFEELETDTLNTHGQPGLTDRRASLRIATARCLEKLLQTRDNPARPNQG